MRYLLFLFIAASLQAQVALEGPWRMTRQDSPALALPETPDGDWAEVQLPWKERPANGIFWLRKTVTLDAALPVAALVVGRVGSSFEVYVNGERIGTVPGFGSRIVEVWQPRQFRLPRGLPAGPVTIALRCWEIKVWWAAAFDEGGPYRLGNPAMAEAALDRFWIQSRDTVYPRLLISVAQVALGFYLILVWRRDLFGLGFFLVAWGGLWCFYSHLRGYESHANSIWSLLVFSLAMAGWIAWVTASLDLLGFSPRLRRFLIPPVAAIPFGLILWPYLDPGADFNGSVTVLPAQALTLGLAAYRIWQRTYVGPALLVSAASLISLLVNLVGTYFGLAAAQAHWQGFYIPVTPVAYLVTSVWMSVEYLERLKRQRAERDRLASEMDSARGVQASLLSINTLNHAGYQAEAVYQPALDVGGDFYELIAGPDGTMLVVAGDVSGKGLQAAMVVALALGALRNRHASTPAALLAEMNRSLVQRKAGGFVTCAIARLEPDGHITVASAGHPAPFLAGPSRATTEWTPPPGLPLGVTPDASYEEAAEQLAIGEQLVLISDGVVEAESAQRELFGFDRTRDIASKSAQEIAEAAKAWGQNDDITVVTVRRNA